MQDSVVANCKRHCAKLAADHEDLAVRVATVQTKLSEEGILAKFGNRAAYAWRGTIFQRGWSS